MASEILGDRKKKRYDEGLIDLVNAKYAKEVISDNLSDLWVVEDESYDTGNSKIFMNWLKKFHEDGKVMASMGDLYKYFKTCVEQSDYWIRGYPNDRRTKEEAKENLEIISSKISKLHEDFEHGLMGNTRMYFVGDKDCGEIGHNFSHNQDLGKDELLKLKRQVRIWDGVYLTDIIEENMDDLLKKDPKTERLLKATFETSDAPEEILSVLRYVSDSRIVGLSVSTQAVRSLAVIAVPVLSYGGSYNNERLWLDFSHLSTGRARALKGG